MWFFFYDSFFIGLVLVNFLRVGYNVYRNVTRELLCGYLPICLKMTSLIHTLNARYQIYTIQTGVVLSTTLN